MPQMQPSMRCGGLDLGDPLLNGCAGYWPFWEGDGLTVMDLWNGNTGTWTGGHVDWPFWVRGAQGWRGSFGSDTNYVVLAREIPDSTTHTWSCWTHLLDDNGMIASASSVATSYFQYLVAGNWYYSAFDGASSGVNIATGGNTGLHHWAVRRAGTTAVDFFKDGIQFGTETLSANRPVRFGHIGAYNDASLLCKGTLFSALVHLRSLTDGDIASLYRLSPQVGFRTRMWFPAAVAGGYTVPLQLILECAQ